jgi:hypothetical protein
VFREFNAYNRTFSFVSAEATNTRMMGVVGVVAKFMSDDGKWIIQIYHLDYESYGIDGYHMFVTEQKTGPLGGLSDEMPEEILTTLRGVTGGLGGIFVPILFDEFCYLLQSAYQVDKKSIDYLVDFEVMMPFVEPLTVQDKSFVKRVFEKLRPAIINDDAIINYFMMRLFGCDFEAAKVFLMDTFETPEAIEQLVNEPCTLIKNTIVMLEDGEKRMYRASALVDYEEKYQLLMFKLTVTPQKGIDCIILEDQLKVSSIEASFNLNKPEYMLVLHATDAFFERRFERLNPEFMKQHYRSGILFMEFNEDNSHVNENPYYLNGDLYAIYFFTTSGQLVIGSFSKEHINEIDRIFNESGTYDDSVSFVCELRTDYPVMYSFAQSAYDNIFEFLENYQF